MNTFPTVITEPPKQLGLLRCADHLSFCVHPLLWFIHPKSATLFLIGSEMAWNDNFIFHLLLFFWISVPWPGIELRPRQWKPGILTTRPPGNSLRFHLLNIYYTSDTVLNSSYVFSFGPYKKPLKWLTLSVFYDKNTEAQSNWVICPRQTASLSGSWFMHLGVWLLTPAPVFKKSASLFILFIYFWLCWVFVAAPGLSLVVLSGSYSSLWCVGFSLRWLLLLRSTGSRRAGFSSCGSRALERRLSSCGAQA